MSAEPMPSLPDPFAGMTSQQLVTTADRAYREAARCWAEARACQEPTVKAMLLESAASAEEFWTLARDRRDASLTRDALIAEHETHRDADHWLTCDLCDDEAGEPDEADEPVELHPSDCTSCWHDFVTDTQTDHAYMAPYPV